MNKTELGIVVPNAKVIKVSEVELDPENNDIIYNTRFIKNPLNRHMTEQDYFDAQQRGEYDTGDIGEP